jgi:hypothetical protein
MKNKLLRHPLPLLARENNTIFFRSNFRGKIFMISERNIFYLFGRYTEFSKIKYSIIFSSSLCLF